MEDYKQEVDTLQRKVSELQADYKVELKKTKELSQVCSVIHNSNNISLSMLLLWLPSRSVCCCNVSIERSFVLWIMLSLLLFVIEISAIFMMWVLKVKVFFSFWSSSIRWLTARQMTALHWFLSTVFLKMSFNVSPVYAVTLFNFIHHVFVLHLAHLPGGFPIIMAQAVGFPHDVSQVSKFLFLYWF